MGLGHKRSQSEKFYFPANTDILTLFHFEMVQWDENILQKEHSTINFYSTGHQFQKDLTGKPLQNRNT